MNNAGIKSVIKSITNDMARIRSQIERIALAENFYTGSSALHSLEQAYTDLSCARDSLRIAAVEVKQLKREV